MAMNIVGIGSAAILFALLSNVAMSQERQDAATNDVAAPLERPNGQSDASGAPPPPNLTVQQARAERSNNAADRGTTDYFRAAEAAYKATLRKASSDHKAALISCRALNKAEQKNCINEADSQLKLTKAEAERLKPAS